MTIKIVLYTYIGMNINRNKLYILSTKPSLYKLISIVVNTSASDPIIVTDEADFRIRVLPETDKLVCYQGIT